MSGFVRFEGTVPNGHGHHPGVFALANGLARHGILNDTDAVWLRAANDYGERTYPDPSRLDAGVFDRTINPGAKSYFRDDATDLIGMVGDYLHVLDRYGISWREIRTRHPGRIVYEDLVQVVAVPHRFPAQWPFPLPPAHENQ